MIENRLRLILAVISACLAWGVIAFAQGDAEIFILSKDIANDSEGYVTLEFVVRDANGLGANPGNITLSEATEDLTLTEDDRLPITLGIIVDLSQGTNATRVQETLLAYFSDYYNPDDDVTFYILDGTNYTPRVINITNLEEAELAIRGLAPTSRFYLIEQTLEQVLADLEAKGDIPSRARHVLHIGGYLTAPREAQLATNFSNEDIPYHVIKVHSGRPTEDMRMMAQAGTGLFADNFDSSLVIRGETAVNALKTVYDAIAASRTVHILRYRTRNQSLNTFRSVDLSMELSGNQQVQTTFSYSWSFQPPIVTFVNINQLNPLITPDRPLNDNNLTFDKDTQDITVSITYPDDVPRQIESIRLEVVETESGDVQQSTLELTPRLDARDNYILSWSLEEYRQPNSTTPVSLTVTIIDELGQITSVTREGQVQLAAAPAIPTRVPTAVPVEQAGSGTTGVNTVIIGDGVSVPRSNAVVAVNPLGTPIFDDNGQPIVISGGAGISNRWLTILLVAIAVLVAILVLLANRLMRTNRLAREEALIKIELPELPPPDEFRRHRRRASQIVELTRERQYDSDDIVIVTNEQARPYVYDENEFDTRSEAETIAEAEIDPNEGILARLVITEGTSGEIDNIETRMIEVRQEEFTIGRSDENIWKISKPYISPKHTRFTVDGGRILVRDMGSKNGTYINGERLQTARDYTVPIGSEVGISQKIVVQVWNTTANLDMAELRMSQSDTAGSAATGNVVFKSPLPDMEYIGGESDNVESGYSPI